MATPPAYLQIWTYPSLWRREQILESRCCIIYFFSAIPNLSVDEIIFIFTFFYNGAIHIVSNFTAGCKFDCFQLICSLQSDLWYICAPHRQALLDPSNQANFAKKNNLICISFDFKFPIKKSRQVCKCLQTNSHSLLVM